MSVIGSIASLPSAAVGLLTGHSQKARAQALGTQGATGLKPAAATGGATTSSTSSPGTDIGTTFLNLLVKELQNQDPTAPMDSTAMVGQMISLNQLDQLISINQAVNPTSGTLGGLTGATPGVVQGRSASSAATLAARNALLNGISASDPSGVALTANDSLKAAAGLASPSAGTLPFSAADTLNAAAASASNAGALNLTNFNSMFGGK